MTHYEVLGVRKTASADEIKNAYKKLVKKYHPDVYVGDKAFAEKKIKEINEAYDVLSDPEQKQEYDESINPQTTTSYNPQSYTSYGYSAPQYTYKTTSKRNAQARDSKYSYENYRKTYNATNYGSYDYQKRYTDYHRSKTPNSSYSTNNKTANYAENAVNTFFTFSNTSKSLILVLIVIFFIIFFIINTLQITSLLGKESYSSPGSNYTSTPTPTTQESSAADDSYETRNPYLEPEEDSSSDYTVTSPEIPSLNDFNINDVFSDAEIMDAYLAYEGELYTTFESFKEALRVAYYNAYILPYIYSY